MNMIFENSLLALPSGLWRLQQRPYFGRGLNSLERSLPWGTTEKIEDSREHHDVFTECDFDLIHTVATGSFSTVWLGYWRKYKINVAVKMYEKGVTSEFALKSLPIELEVLRMCHHPNITQYYGTWETEFRVYIVLEWAGKWNLLNYLRAHGPVSELQGKSWFAQLVSAINYLHDLKIAHRDIKCENILVDTSHQLRLADFGMAAIQIPWEPSIPNSGWTKYRDFRGSQAYKCPEILMKIPFSPLLADVWAMGVVLYTTLYGTFPFNTEAEELKPTLLPTMLEFPSDVYISKDVISVFKRIFLLEKRRVRSMDLVNLDWFDDEQKEYIFMATYAGKTVKEVEEETEKQKRLESGGEDFWGDLAPALAKSRQKCLKL